MFHQGNVLNDHHVNFTFGKTKVSPYFYYNFFFMHVNSILFKLTFDKSRIFSKFNKNFYIYLINFIYKKS